MLTEQLDSFVKANLVGVPFDSIFDLQEDESPFTRGQQLLHETSTTLSQNITQLKDVQSVHLLQHTRDKVSQLLLTLDVQHAQLEQLIEALERRNAPVVDIREKLKQIINRLAVLQRAREYLNVVHTLETASNQAKQLLETRPLESVEHFLKILDVYDMEYIHGEEQRDSRHESLYLVVLARVNYMFTLLKEQLLFRLNSLLSTMKWPKSPTSLPVDFSAQNVETICKLVRFLIRLQVSEVLHDPEIWSSIKPQDLWVVKRLVDTFAKSFDFHFSGKRQTNLLDKPEWIFAYATACLRDHVQFLEDTIQPVISGVLKSCMVKPELFEKFDCVHGFINSIVDIVASKVEQRIPLITSLPQGFSIFKKTVDELLSFHSLLIEDYEYPEHMQRLLEVLTSSPEIFEFWLKSEKEFVQQQVDRLFQMQDPWSPVPEHIASEFGSSVEGEFSWVDPDVAQMKPSKSSLILLSSVRKVADRFSPVQKMHFRWRFLSELQLQMLRVYCNELDDCLTKTLRRIRNSGSRSVFTLPKDWSEYCNLLNSCEHISLHLKLWQDEIVYIELHRYSSVADTEEIATAVHTRSSIMSSLAVEEANLDDGGVFEPMIIHLESLSSDFSQVLLNLMTEVFDEDLQKYIEKGHMWKSSPMDTGADEVSEEIAQTFSILHQQLTVLNDELSEQGFRKLSWKVAESVGSFINSKVVKGKSFSLAGLSQFVVDMKFLFNLFLSFNISPKLAFAELYDSLRILLDAAERGHEIISISAE
jgi:predicted XRE-type DNA-binding protein